MLTLAWVTVQSATRYKARVLGSAGESYCLLLRPPLHSEYGSDRMAPSALGLAERVTCAAARQAYTFTSLSS